MIPNSRRRAHRGNVRKDKTSISERTVGILFAIDYVEVAVPRKRFNAEPYLLARSQESSLLHSFQAPLSPLRSLFFLDQFLCLVAGCGRTKAPKRDADLGKHNIANGLGAV